MNFIERLTKIIASLFGSDKQAKDLSPEEWEKVTPAYAEEFKVEFDADFASYQESLQKAKQLDSIKSLLASYQAASDEKPKEGEKDKTIEETIVGLQTSNEEMKKTIAELQTTVEEDNTKSQKVNVIQLGKTHSKTHLFGVQSDFFSLEKRWNKVYLNPAIANEAMDDNSVFSAFQTEVAKYGSSLAKLYQQLQANNDLNPEKLSVGLDVGYTSLTDSGLGEQYLVIRQQALIARILTLPNVYDIFPRRFGVQDRELITNAFYGEFSQPYQPGEVWKGEVTLQPELGYVDDVMFKTLFTNMKWIERQYIGYLNQEGSDAIKWTMIEWIVLNIATKLVMEQYKRRIMGIGVKPVSAEAGHYLFGSSGFVYTLVRYIHENKMLPFDDLALSTYDSATMMGVVEAFVSKVREKVEDWNDMEYALMLNSNHKKWYKDNFRTAYGTDNDFKTVNDSTVQDTDVKIIWVPNMGSLKLITLAKPGNFQALEFVPGEMLAIKFLPDMESVKSWSLWKEGFSAAFVGKKFSTLADLKTNDFKAQEVFTNKPSVALSADDTTADGKVGFWFKSIANSKATAITDIVDAKAGVGYIIECGGVAYATTVAKADKFSTLTGAYTPTAVGDYLMVVYDTTASKFFELERCVGGTRTINEAKQPNIPGGR